MVVHRTDLCFRLRWASQSESESRSACARRIRRRNERRTADGSRRGGRCPVGAAARDPRFGDQAVQIVISPVDDAVVRFGDAGAIADIISVYAYDPIGCCGPLCWTMLVNWLSVL